MRFLRKVEKLKVYKSERIGSLTEERSERVGLVAEGCERVSSNRWRTRSDNEISAQSRKNGEEVLVFIGGVHGRRSGTSIQDTDQSTSNTCHRLKCLCSLSDLHGHDGVSLRRSPSKCPRHRYPLSPDRHHFDSITNHSVCTITVLVLCYRLFTLIRHPYEYGTIIIVCFNRHPN